MAPKKFQLNFDDMIKKLKDQEKTFVKKEPDETLFVPKYKDDGTHASIIRFIPSPDTDVPMIKKFNHGFQGNGGWYIEECPATIGQKCPVCETQNSLWTNGMEEEYRLRKKRVNYYANILVVKDPQTPENEGKVFKYRFGKKIYDKIMEKISPNDGISDSVMVFDWYDGANFKLVIKQIKVANKKPQANYDSSVFADKSAVGDDAYIESVMKNSHPLGGLIAPEIYKSYEDLCDKFEKVTKSSSPNEVRQTSVSDRNKNSQGDDETLPETSQNTDGVLGDETQDDFFAKLREKKA